MFGLIVTAKNEMSLVEYDPPNYEVIQKAVGGWYERVNPVGLEHPYRMMVNEEGLLRNLPLNLVGSLLYGTEIHGHPIVGDVIFLKLGYCGGEPNVVGMTEDEAQTLGDRFAEMTNGLAHWVSN